jgi:3-oxoadipate enol-lactonase
LGQPFRAAAALPRGVPLTIRPLDSIDDIRLYYRLEGLDDKPVLVFAHSLGVDHGQWDPQVADLLPHFRVLRYDLRGHGGSDVPTGDYSIERLGRDALALADALGVERFAFCGLSIGGMIAQWVGANAGDRLTRLILANTSPRTADPNPMEQRRRIVLAGGMTAAIDAIMGRWFTPETPAPEHVVAGVRRTVLSTSPVGYAGCCAAVRDMDLTGALGAIRVPTLVIGGSRDLSTPWPDHGARIAAAIPGAKTVMLDAGHLSNIERPREFTAALLDFLK